MKKKIRAKAFFLAPHGAIVFERKFINEGKSYGAYERVFARAPL